MRWIYAALGFLIIIYGLPALPSEVQPWEKLASYTNRYSNKWPYLSIVNDAVGMPEPLGHHERLLLRCDQVGHVGVAKVMEPDAG